MPDAHKSTRHYVEEEASEKLFRRERHDAILIPVGVIAPTKADAAFPQRQESVIGDGHAMGVACQIPQHLLWAAEGRLGIDHPFLLINLPKPFPPATTLGQRSESAMQTELAVTPKLL